MQEPHVEGVADHDGPELRAGAREGGGEALIGETAGWYGAALAREAILLRPHAIAVGLNEAIEEACRDAGLGPAVFVRHAAPQMSSIIGLVAAGFGVSVVPSSMGSLLRGNVAYRRLTGPGRLTAPIAFARRVGTREVAANRLEEIALDAAGRHGHDGGLAESRRLP